MQYILPWDILTLAFQMELSIILIRYGLHRKIRVVTRLDKDTSGAALIAKNDYIQDALTLQMQNGSFKKEYIGVLEGNVKPKSGTINAKIARKEGSIIERCINDNGQSSITHYDVIDIVNNMSMVHFVLETGRTHQIRVHSKYIGHPIIRRYVIWKLLPSHFKTSFACLQNKSYTSNYKEENGIYSKFARRHGIFNSKQKLEARN